MDPFFRIETDLGVNPFGSGSVFEVTSKGTMREVQGAGGMGFNTEGIALM